MEELGIGIAVILPFLVLMFILIAAQWKIFVKAGKPGWACLIPIYSGIVLLEIVGKPTWWIVMFLIPGVNLIFAIWATNMLSKSFGKDEGFTVGLLLLSIVFYPILGFGSAQYQGPYGEIKTNAHNAHGGEKKLDDILDA